MPSNEMKKAWELYQKNPMMSLVYLQSKLKINFQKAKEILAELHLKQAIEMRNLRKDLELTEHI